MHFTVRALRLSCLIAMSNLVLLCTALASNAFANSEGASQIKAPVNAASNADWPLILFTFFGIICFILLLAWFAKRFTGFSGMHAKGLKVVSAIPVGTRERIALIDVNGKQILVGVTPQNISHLCTFDEPVIATKSSKTSAGDFASKLQSLLSSQSTTLDSRTNETKNTNSASEGKSND